MKTLVTTYTFDPTAKTITFAKPYTLEQILLITNVTTNAIIYNFADPATGGAIVGSVLTLDFNTTAMSAEDKLQIFVDDITTVQPINGTVTINNSSTVPIPITGVQLDDIEFLLARLLNAFNSPQGYDKSQQRQRGTVVVESGTVTTVSTVTTVNTVSNVSTVDTLQGRIHIYGANLSAWNDVVRSKIT